jgi:hypothetical protein
VHKRSVGETVLSYLHSFVDELCIQRLCKHHAAGVNALKSDEIPRFRAEICDFGTATVASRKFRCFSA